MNNRTFAIIKPDAVKNGNTGKIYDRILRADFKILCAKLLRMTEHQVKGFYAVHKERPFFNELTEFMSSGACMVLALEKENAVHGSDSNENAEKEIGFFFSQSELIANK